MLRGFPRSLSRFVTLSPGGAAYISGGNAIDVRNARRRLAFFFVFVVDHLLDHL